MSKRRKPDFVLPSAEGEMGYPRDMKPGLPDQSLPEGVERLEPVLGPDRDIPHSDVARMQACPDGHYIAVADLDLPAILEQARQEERERVLGALREWLGEDDEYEALTAIADDLKANPQLVPERDVPLRLLQALQAAVKRFTEQQKGSGDV